MRDFFSWPEAFVSLWLGPMCSVGFRTLNPKPWFRGLFFMVLDVGLFNVELYPEAPETPGEGA